jgi:aryl-alcohol dehydrogenase-like predicted oxidoreductase
MPMRRRQTSVMERGVVGIELLGPQLVMDRESAIALVRKAVDVGVMFVDTAQVYGPFTNEQLVGDATAAVR